MLECEGRIPDFIEKVIRMMKKHPNLINWGNQGEELVVLNQKQFQQKVLNQYFRHGKLQSFVRQVFNFNYDSQICMDFTKSAEIKIGNEANFYLIKRRKKDGQDEQQPVSKIENNFITVITEKHQNDFPSLPSIAQQILHLKQLNSKTITKLRKSLDALLRQINDRKSKQIKPMIVEIKQMISSIQDSGKRVGMSMEQLIQETGKEKNQIKKEEYEPPAAQIKMEEQQLLEPILAHMNQSLSYPALHNPNGFFTPVFHTGATILGVPSICSFNSSANYMS